MEDNPSNASKFMHWIWCMFKAQHFFFKSDKKIKTPGASGIGLLLIDV
jgi:hypothetical protein